MSRIVYLDNLFLDDLKSLEVSEKGIPFLMAKSRVYAFKIEGISSVKANILKQEMLSLGGDAALPADIYHLDNTASTIIIFGTLKVFRSLYQKLRLQNLNYSEIIVFLEKFLKVKNEERFLRARKYNISLKRPIIMGIVNLTPDSFFDGGFIKDIDSLMKKLEDWKGKVSIIDLGGESSRPGSKPVSLSEELDRVIPVIKRIKENFNFAISIDTYKEEVAQEALKQGACIVNDIKGITKEMAQIVASFGAGIVIMHMQGLPENMQENPQYNDILMDINDFFIEKISIALDAGISPNSIVIDPGIGFGKTFSDNIHLLKNIRSFRNTGYPVLIGLSRKSFLGHYTGRTVDERLSATIVANTIALLNGADIIRVHDVDEAFDTIRITEQFL